MKISVALFLRVPYITLMSKNDSTAGFDRIKLELQIDEALDMAELLEEEGDLDRAAKLREEAAELRKELERK